MKKVRRESIDNQLLTEANAKNSKAVAALLNPVDEKLDDEAYKAERLKQIEALVKAEDSSFLFGSSNPDIKGMKFSEGADSQNGGVDPKTMSYEQLCEYLAQNPDAQL